MNFLVNPIEFLIDSVFFFFLSALGMFHPLLPSVVSDEKSAVNLVEAPLHVTNCILLAAMKSLFVSIFDSLCVSVLTF